MADSRASGERAPLLRGDSSSRTLSSASKSSQPLLDDEERGGDEENGFQISRSRGALIVCSVGLLIFLTATNFSILTTTQSSIAADLDAFENVSWLTSSYLIAMSSLAPLLGRLSQVFSPRLCLFVSTVIIAIGNIIDGIASNFNMFIVGRVVTGVGAAGVFVVASIIVIQMVSAKQRGLFLGLVNGGMTIGVSLGAVIAGALEPRIGWKPLFGMQAPLSLLAGLGLLYGIPSGYKTKNEYSSQPLRTKLARIDYSGSVLLIVTIFLFLLGLSGPRVLPIPLILSAIALPAFILNEIYIAKDPAIPIAVLRSRGTLLTCLGTVGFMMARWTVLFYTPVYALSVRGWHPAVAGSILIPTNAGFATGGLLAGYFHIHRHGSFYVHTLVSMGLVPIALLVLAFISTANSSPVLYVITVFSDGLLTGAALNYALVHVLHLTLDEIHPIVISLLATFRGFAGSFGSAIGGGIFGRVLNKSLRRGFDRAGLKHRGDLIRRLLGSPALVGRLEGAERAIATAAYHDALKTLFLAAVGLAVIVVFIQAGTGWTAPTKPSEEVDSGDEAQGEEGLLAGS